jgi:hypothetical protein
MARVQNAPLLLSDRRSIKKADLIEVDKVLPDKVEKAFFLYHRQDQKWFYLPDQEPDEVALFITWRPDEEPLMAGKFRTFAMRFRTPTYTRFQITLPTERAELNFLRLFPERVSRSA